jgi:hypothetical protein
VKRELVVRALAKAGVLDEDMNLDPDAVRELCKTFVESFYENCRECIEQDTYFWSLSQAEKLTEILSYTASLYAKEFVTREDVETSIRITQESVNACSEGIASALKLFHNQKL